MIFPSIYQIALVEMLEIHFYYSFDRLRVTIEIYDTVSFNKIYLNYLLTLVRIELVVNVVAVDAFVYVAPVYKP